jgi:AcrR family transcriptional regulator
VSTGERGRVAQKRRTRKEIVAAAARLLARGATPSVNDVAAEADVSRRTVYMYFPTLEQLLVDAALASITEDKIDSALDAPGDDDSEARLDALARNVQGMFASTEKHGRTLLRLTVDTDRVGSKDQPVRGYRRVEWIERALAPMKKQVSRAAFDRLVSALAMVIGWESLIVARDIRGLGLDEAEEVSAWAARTLLRATLDERGARKAGTGSTASGRPGRPRASR